MPPLGDPVLFHVNCLGTGNGILKILSENLKNKDLHLLQQLEV